MKKLIIVAGAFALLAGCRSAATPAPAPGVSPTPGAGASAGTIAVGAPDPRGAVKSFLAASETGDLQALAAVWGSKSGSARDNIPRDTLEKRELIMMAYLKHDKYDILSDAPSTTGARVFAVQFTCGKATKTANFDVVPGPAGRWYVQDFDMPALADLCKKKGTVPGGL